MLKCFGALPTEERAKAMREEDYLWCAVNLLLDEEEVGPSAVPSVPGGGGEGPVPGVRPGDGKMVRRRIPPLTGPGFRH